MTEPVPGRPLGPAGHWLTGNLGAYERDRLGFVLDAHARFGPVVAFDNRTTLIADPQLIARLLRDPRAGVTHDVLLRPLDAHRSEVMSAVRELSYPSVRRVESARLERLLTTQLEDAIERLTSTRPGVPLTIEPAAFLETAIARGVNRFFLGAEGSLLGPGVRDLLDDLSRLIGNPLAPPSSWRTPLRRRIHKRHEALVAQIRTILDRRRRSPMDDVASAVLVHPKSHRFEGGLIAEMLLGSLLASQRVPAAAAAWMLHLIATATHTQESIRSQMRDGEAREGTNWLRAAAFESLRLYPATWLLQRAALQPLSVGGFHFDAGHQFLMSPYAVHRSPDYFEHPNDFHPLRWSSAGAPTTSARAAFMPFGDGVHRCPGRHLALVALEVISAHLCKHYRLSELGERVTAQARTTLVPRGSLIRLEPLK